MTEKPQDFDTPIDVYRYLKASGWKIGKSKVYNDCGTKLKPGEDGKFSLESVELYALKHLKRLVPDGATESVADELERLHLERLRREVSLRKRQEEKLRFDLERKKGRYLPRSEFETLLAARWVVLRAGFKAMVDLNLDAWISLIEDDPDKGRLSFRQAIQQEFLVLLNEFARMPEITVVADGDPVVEK